MKTILLLDDDENILSTFGLALRHHGYRVIEASSGDKGIELARQYLPDLILSDISMPGSDGQAVLEQIRKSPELSGCQVVLMTGQTHLVTPRRGMELGADDFLVKPISLGDLLRCVEARLKRADVHWRVEDRMLTKLRITLHSTLPHELFTPLGGILGLAEILETDAANLSPEEVAELVKDIHHSGLRLHRTLRNYLMILDVEDTIADAAEITVTTALSFRELKDSLTLGVQAALRLRHRAEDVSIDIKESSPAYVRTDDMELIGEELADNACKFSRPGTKISVYYSTDGVFTVSDEGRGMSAEEIAQVGSFQQFDRKKQEQQGLGLGLALVQKLAARCGAKFSIESELTKGTTVKVAFRLAKKQS